MLRRITYKVELRCLVNDLGIPLVCLGTDLARQALLLTDAQLAERFGAIPLKTWKTDAAFAGLLKSLRHILPLRASFELASAATRASIHVLISGVTARIFRLIDTTAEAAIYSGQESRDAENFGDTLVLPRSSSPRY